MQKKSDKTIINHNLKAISTLIGNILMNLIIGNSLVWVYLSEKLNLNLETKANQNVNMSNQTSNKSTKIIISLILTFSNLTKLYFTIFTKYTYIRWYIIFSLLPIIITHLLLLYMLENKFANILAFIIYGIGIGVPYHQLIKNTSLHFISIKFYILLISKICYNISPLLYFFIFKKLSDIVSPIGGEIIIFYLVILIICSLISFDYLRECRIEKFESNEQKLLIKNELEYSISDITETTERSSTLSEDSVDLEKKQKIFLDENENINRVFLSKKHSFISVFSDKNIYLIILFTFFANFLTFEKIYMIKSEDIVFFLLIIFISNVIIFIIFSKTQVPSIILRLVPLFIHILIIIYHTFNSRKESFSKKIELFLVSLSYSFQMNYLLPLSQKLYGEKNAIFFSSLILNFSTSSRLIFIFINNVRNSLRILIVVFMILMLLFINTNTFNFNKDKKAKFFGVELQDKDEDKNEEKENEVQERVDIADVKSDFEI